jgi:peptide/nickel transport system ATP-binding protein
VAEVRGLEVSVKGGGRILRGVTCEVKSGEILGLAGETGSGKTTLALSFLCYVGPGLTIDDGVIVISGREVLSAQAASPPPKKGPRELRGLREPRELRGLRELRGKEVSYVPQDPGGALAPSLSVKESFMAVMRAHGAKDADQSARRLRQLFEIVGLPRDDAFLNRLPHQLSGGQQQRVAIAIAFAHSPRLVVMDEPTSGLDATTTRKIVEFVKDMSRRLGASMIFVSHDLRLLLSLSDRITVLYHGEIVETLSTVDFVRHAEHPYTKRLIDALPKADAEVREEQLPEKHPLPQEMQNDVLSVEGLTAMFGLKAVTHSLSFSIKRGSCLAFIGESGSGKTTTARCIAGVHSAYEGRILVEGSPLPRKLVKRSLEQRQRVQYVFQNPTASLNPRRTVGSSVMAALESYQRTSKVERLERAAMLMRDVGLSPDHLHALPHQLSGGQKQRVCLARALAAEPALLICDEVTSSLDVIVQSEIIGLIHRLQHEHDLTVLFITHDFGLAKIISVETMVILDGNIVESGPTDQVIESPQHPYTQNLVACASLNAG